MIFMICTWSKTWQSLCSTNQQQQHHHHHSCSQMMYSKVPLFFKEIIFLPQSQIYCRSTKTSLFHLCFWCCRYVMQSSLGRDQSLEPWARARAPKEGPRVLMNLRVDFWAHGPRLGPIIFVHIRLECHYIWSLYLGLHNVGRVP